MSWHRIKLALCPGCGRDIARALPAMPSGFSVMCQPEEGGCGCTGCAGDTEAEAVMLWNAGLVASGVHHAA